MTVKQQLVRLLQERILVLDGGMGTMLQRYSLGEDDYRGDRFLSWEGQLKVNKDLLCINRPDVIAAIHYQYLDAGADIFTTNTFNANAISQADYNAQHLVKEINLAAGRLARSVADDYMSKHAGRTIFVAGSIGPTNKTASMSPDVNDPAYRAVSYTDLYLAYREQIADNSVDCIRRAILYFGYKPQIIQTDNGSEFTFTQKVKGGRQHTFDKFCEEQGIEHKTIKPRTPRHNGKVERSHRSDNERFYKYLRFHSFDDLKTQMKAYLRRSNNIPMSVLKSKDGKRKWLTPKEKRRELLLLDWGVIE